MAADTTSRTACTCGEGKATLHFSNCRLYTDQLLKPQKPSGATG